MELASRRRPIAVVAIAIGTAAILAAGLAASHSVAAESDAAPSPLASGYLPSISDLMIATIQPRHERLWQAGHNGNWDFAAYELGNLKGAFDRLGRAHPTQGGISLRDMITSVTQQPSRELSAAIYFKDGVAFAKAYADLTDACNSCHQALNHGLVEIRVPNQTSTSDLDANGASH